MADFVYQSEKYFNSKIKLSEEQFAKFKQVLRKRDQCWNSKSDEISGRQRKKDLYNRASTAHQNGEKEAKKLYEDYYKLKVAQEKLVQATKAAEKAFAEAHEELEQWENKLFQQFMKKVDEFTQKALEVYPFQEAEESEDEADKRFNKAFNEFEGIDEL